MKLHRYRTFLCAACVLALALVALAPGRAAGAPITISNITDLQKIGNDAAFPLDGDYVLGGDIDASATATWNSGAGFIPIGSSSTPFTGTFDGKGKAIREFKINRTGEEYIGLFGYAQGATLKDVNFDNATVYGDNYVGILAGYSEYGPISGCSITGMVTSDEDSDGGYVGAVVGYINFGNITYCTSAAKVFGGYYYTGGIAGYDDYANIANCSVTGSVGSYEEYTGGIVGYIEYGNISNCSMTAAVNSYYYYTGGIAGESEYNTIDNCYATGSVAADDDEVGGLVGETYNTDITNCYAKGTVNGEGSYVGGLVGYFEQGSMTNCYATGTVNGDDETGGLVGEYYHAAAMTDCYATGPVNGSDEVGGLVGYTDYGSITDCYATGPVNGYDYVGGLVGENYYCPIKNSHATGTVASYEEVGGLVGYNYESNIANCYATGTVNGSDYYVGGLVGYTDYGSITDSYATGSVLGYEEAGGLVGYFEDGSIINCHATGSVSVGDYEAGGLVGYNDYGNISKCYATGSVNAGDSEAGGLVGYNYYSYISNCYATGSVNAGYDEVGGLVGYNDNSYIDNSYSTGTANSGTDFGGLVGYNSSGGVRNSFWDTQTSGLADSDGGEGKTTVEMKAKATFTAAGWDFDKIWSITEGQTYPLLIETNAGNPPVANSDNYTTKPDTPLTVAAAEGVLVNDSSPNGGTLIAQVVQTTKNGSLSLAVDGSFIYIPEKRFRGEDTFTYKVNDGTLDSAPATVTIKVGRSLCPAVKLFGENSGQVKLLRTYRDTVLAKTAAGSLAIDVYYELAPVVDALLNSSPQLSRKAAKIINMLLPALQRSMKR